MMTWKHLMAAGAAFTLCGTVLGQDADAGEEAAAAVEAAEAAAEKDLWDMEFSLGLNGSRGSTDSNDVRVGFIANRETKRDVFDLNLSYLYSNEDDSDTENNFIGLARNDWKFADESRWSFFVDGEYEYNKFQSFENRARAGAGLGYRIIKDENATLRASLGSGYTYSWGDVDDGYIYGLIGLDFETKISDNQKLKAGVTYFPSLEDGDEFRLVMGASYSIELNDDGNLSLRLGVENRKDSQGDPKSDTDMYLMLVYGF